MWQNVYREMWERHGEEICVSDTDRRESKLVSLNMVETFVATWKRDLMYVKQYGSERGGKVTCSEQCGRDSQENVYCDMLVGETR